MGAASCCGAVQEAEVRHLEPHPSTWQYTGGARSKMLFQLALTPFFFKSESF
jgi:hypothetical protein